MRSKWKCNNNFILPQPLFTKKVSYTFYSIVALLIFFMHYHDYSWFLLKFPWFVFSIQTDHNEDQTYNVLQKWKENMQRYYHRIILKHEAEPILYKDSISPNQWTEERYLKVLQLRQNALQEARNQWADYILVSIFLYFFYFYKSWFFVEKCLFRIYIYNNYINLACLSNNFKYYPCHVFS